MTSILKRVFIPLSKADGYYTKIGVSLLKEDKLQYSIDLYVSNDTVKQEPKSALKITKEELEELYKALGILLNHKELKERTEELDDVLI